MTKAATNVPIQLAIFDLDGTLLDTAEDIAAAVNRLRGRLDLEPVPAPVVLEWVGDGAGRLVERALGLPEGATGVSEEAAAHLAAFRADYGEHLLVATRPYRGVERMLARLAKRGLRMAVVSNKPVDMVERLLAATGLAARFFAVLGGDSLVTRKPAPEPIMNVVMRAAVRREATVMIGDGPQDLLAGRAAGVRTIAATWGFTPRARLEAIDPDAIADRPADLPKRIAEL